MPELTDQECLAILTADPRNLVAAKIALETLMHRYNRRLQCTLRNRCFSLTQEDIADVSQETWMRVWERLEAKVMPEAFRAWLFRVGINLANDLLRKKVARPEMALGERNLPSGQPNHVHELEFRETLQHCVEKLSPQDRAFLARLFNLESFDEIAAALQRRVERIYQMKHEIGKKLLRCLRGESRT